MLHLEQTATEIKAHRMLITKPRCPHNGKSMLALAIAPSSSTLPAHTVVATGAEMVMSAHDCQI